MNLDVGQYVQVSLPNEGDWEKSRTYTKGSRERTLLVISFYRRKNKAQQDYIIIKKKKKKASKQRSQDLKSHQPDCTAGGLFCCAVCR